LVSQHHPSNAFLRVRAGNGAPMGGSNFLNPPQVNGVVHMILLVDVPGHHCHTYFKRCSGHQHLQFISQPGAVMLSEGIAVGQALRLPQQPMRLLYKKRRQKMLNRRINSWRASIACAGFIRLSTFSRRSRSIAASSRTNWLRAFHFAYLPAPMPSASSAETTQTVMSVVVTRSITSENRSPKVSLLHDQVQAVLGERGRAPPLFLASARAPQQFMVQP